MNVTTNVKNWEEGKVQNLIIALKIQQNYLKNVTEKKSNVEIGHQKYAQINY